MARVLIGTVVSDKAQKTVTVKVDRRKRHPLYSKSYIVSKKFHVHDEKEEANLGDVVEIEETRPISKNKSWKLTKIVERAEGARKPEDVLSVDQEVVLGEKS